MNINTSRWFSKLNGNKIKTYTFNFIIEKSQWEILYFCKAQSTVFPTISALYKMPRSRSLQKGSHTHRFKI